MTGVIYARYSSDNQREESIEGQIRENTAFAEKNGIVFVGHYIDRAVSTKINNHLFFNKKSSDIKALASPKRTPLKRGGVFLVTHGHHRALRTSGEKCAGSSKDCSAASASEAL